MKIKTFYLQKKEFLKDFGQNGKACTLNPSEMCKNESGWIIEGEIISDYYEWVNDFKASHKKYGKVWGNFEDIVYADSEEGYQHFFEHHEPHVWDYADI